MLSRDNRSELTKLWNRTLNGSNFNLIFVGAVHLYFLAGLLAGSWVDFWG